MKKTNMKFNGAVGTWSLVGWSNGFNFWESEQYDMAYLVTDLDGNVVATEVYDLEEFRSEED